MNSALIIVAVPRPRVRVRRNILACAISEYVTDPQATGRLSVDGKDCMAWVAPKVNVEGVRHVLAAHEVDDAIIIQGGLAKPLTPDYDGLFNTFSATLDAAFQGGAVR